MYILILLLVVYVLLLVYSSIKVGKDYESELNRAYVKANINEDVKDIVDMKKY